jgi:hypothetical protein
MSETSPSQGRQRETRRFIFGLRLASTILIGIVSVMIALTAVLTSHYIDIDNTQQSVASRISIESVRTSERQYAEHAQDVAIWTQILASNETLETSPLASLLSPRWQAAVSRQEAQGTTGMPTDDQYWNELNADAESTDFEVNQIYERAQDAASRATFLTIVSVVYTAAVLLLSLCATSPTASIRVLLLVAASVLIVVAVSLQLTTLLR